MAWLSLVRRAKDFSLTYGLHAYYVPILILMFADLVLNAIMFFQPQWIWLPPSIRVVTTAAFLGIVESAAKLQPFIVLKAQAAQSIAQLEGRSGLQPDCGVEFRHHRGRLDHRADYLWISGSEPDTKVFCGSWNTGGDDQFADDMRAARNFYERLLFRRSPGHDGRT